VCQLPVDILPSVFLRKRTFGDKWSQFIAGRMPFLSPTAQYHSTKRWCVHHWVKIVFVHWKLLTHILSALPPNFIICISKSRKRKKWWSVHDGYTEQLYVIFRWRDEWRDILTGMPEVCNQFVVLCQCECDVTCCRTSARACRRQWRPGVQLGSRVIWPTGSWHWWKPVCNKIKISYKLLQ